MTAPGPPEPGWYPDPAGQPGTERYWDGDRWSEITRAAQGPVPSAEPQRRTGLIAGLVTLALVLIAGVVVTVVLVGGGDEDGPSGTVAGGEDQRSSPVPDLTAKPDIDYPGDCPAYDDSVGVAGKGDGKVYGGGLVMPAPEGYTVNEQEYDYAWPFPWGMDFMVAERSLSKPGWYSTVVMSRLPQQKGFETTRETAGLVLTCIVESRLWFPTGEWKIEVSEGREVDGHEAWLLVADVGFEGERAAELPPEAQSETTYVMVVDMGPDADYGLLTASTTDLPEDSEVPKLIEKGLEKLSVE